MDILKNPVIIGVVSGIMTYVYMNWQVSERNKLKRKNKKNKKENEKEEEVNLLIPLIVCVIVWFLVYGYLEYSEKSSVEIKNQINSNINTVKQPLQIANDGNFRFANDLNVTTSSSDPKSFSLLTGGITVPTKLPDVLIDMY
jgi:hypothetical protein